MGVDKNGKDITYVSMQYEGNNFISCPLGDADGSCKDPSEVDDQEDDDSDDEDEDGKKGGQKGKGKGKGKKKIKGKGKGKGDGQEGSGCPAGTLVFHKGSHCCKEKVDKNGKD